MLLSRRGGRPPGSGPEELEFLSFSARSFIPTAKGEPTNAARCGADKYSDSKARQRQDRPIKPAIKTTKRRPLPARFDG